MQEFRSLVKMDAILVLAPLEKSLVLITPVVALMKETHTMKEKPLSLVKMVVILVLVLLEKSLVLITPVVALIKAVIIMKEILSLA